MVQVSTDKLAVEYREVPVGYFMAWYAGLLFQKVYKVKRTEYKKLFVYQLHIRLEKGIYLHCIRILERRAEAYTRYGWKRGLNITSVSAA